MTSTLIEMGAVLRAMPGPDAPVAEVAAWYERKATLLEHLATETGPSTLDGQRAAALARQAHVRAAALAGGSRGSGECGPTWLAGRAA